MDHRRMWRASGAIALAAALFASQATAEEVNIYTATIGETNQKAPEISTQQMRSILTDRSAVVLDARSRAEFVNGHIPGAQTLAGLPKDAAARVEALVGGDKSKPLVLYCNGPFCQASRRLSTQLVDAGFTNVRRYQLGMPIWRALGGPTALELDGVVRIYKNDHTAVFLDARSAKDFAAGSLAGARNLPAEKGATVRGSPMPLDDFNTRIVLFGRDAKQARALADALSKRPWHNVAYFSGTFNQLSAALQPR